MSDRFSKKTLSAWLWTRMDSIEKQFGFTTANGWDQVRGKGEEFQRAYGKYEEMQILADRWQLEREL